MIRHAALCLFVGLFMIPSSVAFAENPNVGGRKLALVIGVTDYDVTKMNKLNYSVRDARLFGETLIRMGFPRNDVVFVTDAHRFPADPSPGPCCHERIKLALQAFLAKAASVGVIEHLVLYYAGHGASHNGVRYLLPSDADKEPANWPTTAISVDDLLEKLRGLKNLGTVTVILDACRTHSGAGPASRAADDGVKFSAGFRTASADGSRAGTESGKTDKSGSMLLLSAASDGNKSYEDEKFGHGIFTYFLQRELSLGYESRRPHVPQVKDFFDSLKLRTATLALQLGYAQQPTILTGDSSGPTSFGKVPEWTTITADIRMTIIPSGEAEIGGDDADAVNKGIMLRKAKYTQMKPIHMSVREITRGEYDAVMTGAADPKLERSGFPKTGVTMMMAHEFCLMLTEREAKLQGHDPFVPQRDRPKRQSFRLPTEQEWEYACRAGGASQFPPAEIDWLERSKDNPRPRAKLLKYLANMQTEAVAQVEVADPFLHPEDKVNSATFGIHKRWGNYWGLHDMHGNVAEWCTNQYECTTKSVLDDQGRFLDPEMVAVVRGGSFMSKPEQCGAAYRRRCPSNASNDDVGFRIVCELSD